jgi:hypothetical protein
MLHKIFITFLGIFTFSSCTEIITLDLNSSDPQIVVEASVPTSERAVVKLTKSINFDHDNIFPPVENAIITLSDNIGNSEVLTQRKPGIYTSNSIVGLVGRSYSLSIVSGENTIASTCSIPNKVRFDSLRLSQSFGYSRTAFGGKTKVDTLYQLTARFNDPISETNYYRFVEYKNGVSTGSIYIFDDRLTNGKTVERNLFNLSRKLSIGDTVTVEMQCIQKEVYEYFNSFGNNRMGSSTPANPYTNLTGTALGYFSTHTVERKRIIIK